MSLLRALLDSLRLWAILGLLIGHCFAFANCRKSLETLSPTEQIISYMEALFEGRYVAKPDNYMRTLIQDIDSNKPLNGLPLQKSEDKIHEESFASHLGNPELDRAQLKAWLLEKLNEAVKVVNEKSQSKAKTADYFSEMKFNRIKPTRIDTMLKKPIQSFEIDTPFEMMQTPVAHRMWQKVIDSNPSGFKQLGSDYPVEKITWWSAAVFANRLSVMKGLTPVYDFSEIKFWLGSVEDGNYRPAQINQTQSIRINAPDGDIYQAEGYRLPTLQEYQLIIFQFDDRSDKNEMLMHGNPIGAYAWLSKNSDNKTHGVAERLPFIVDDNYFYDIYGNVKEWTHTFVQSPKIGHRLNPQTHFNDPSIGAAYLTAGSFAESEVFFYHERTSDGESPGNARFDIGFRLARSLPKEKIKVNK